MPLQVTVTPEITVDENTIITPAVLNRLASPIVDIRGEVDGTSSVAVGEHTIENVHLANMQPQTVKGLGGAADGEPKNLTLENLIVVGTTLKIKDLGVGTTQIADGAVTAPKLASLAVTPDKLALQPVNSLLGNPSSTQQGPPEGIKIGAGLTVTSATEISVSLRARTSNVARIDTAGNHGLSNGDKVNVTSSTDATFNAYGATVTILSTTAFTYPNTGADVTSGADANMRVREIDQASLVVVANTKVEVTSFRNVSGVNFSGSTLPLWPAATMTVFKKDASTDFQITFTPKLASSFLLIEVIVPIYSSASNAHGWLALFQDPETLNATAVHMSGLSLSSAWFGEIRLTHYVAAGNTNPKVFKLKCAGASTFFNGQTGDTPTPQSIFRVTEIPV